MDWDQHLVGRQAELNALASVLDQVIRGEPFPRLVELTGDAGIGKTALVSEFTKAAQANAATVLASWRTSSVPQTPLGMFSTVFHGHERPLPVAVAEGTPAEWREPAAPFVTSEDGYEARAGAEPRLLRDPYHAVRELLEELASPVLVLALDDLHAIDPLSLDLLASLLRQPPQARVLFVLSYRDRQATTTLRSAIDGWSPQVAATHIHLGPLSEADVEEILAQRGIASWRRQLYEASWGNPAYLQAVIAERLTSSGHLGSPKLDLSARSRHYAIFQGELDALSGQTRSVADAAAVAGREFDAGLVVQMLDLPEAETLRAIGELISCDLIRPVGRGPYFAFRHPVVHRAVYHGSELSRRIQLHTRADAVLRDRGAPVAERAPHVEQWATHGDLDAADVLDEAARAITATDPATAAAWLATALRLLPQQPRFHERRARLLVRQAKARGAAGDLRGCRQIMHEALATLPKEPTAEHAKAVAFTAMVQRLLGSHAETEAMLRAELDAFSGKGPAECALMFEMASAELSNGDWVTCARWANKALALAQEDGNLAQQLACHGLIAKANVRGGDLHAAGRHLDMATAILDGMLDGDFPYSLDAVVWVGWSDTLLERWDDALRHFGRAVEFASESGRLLALPHLLVGQVFALYNRGKVAEAQAAAEYAVYLAQGSGSREQLISAYSTLAWTDTLMGRFGRGAECAAFAANHLRGGARGFEAIALRMLAEARLMTGDAEGCLALVDVVGGPNLPVADACSRIAWYELLTRAALAMRRPEAAVKWVERATAAASLLDQPGRNALAMLAQAQALLAVNPDSALSSAEQAASGLASAGSTIDALRARVVLGVALWHHGRYDDAVRELKDAQTALEQLGAASLAKTASTERRRLAARKSRAEASRSDGSVAALTHRERQIAELVRNGLTNRLIAKNLHISEKTVEMHLSKVFAKLGVSNRAAVAALVTWDRPTSERPGGIQQPTSPGGGIVARASG